MKNILLINGPNLNLLGKRDTKIYGNKTINDVEDMLVKFIHEKDLKSKFQMKSYQSNHEGDLIDFIQANTKDSHAIIINPGGLTTVGFSLLDAIIDSKLPAVEVHISNIHEREEFRRNSIFPNYCDFQITGLGIEGYKVALEKILNGE
tara:strand:+ start:4092 stop:4535 length:444 start_codon:yes stop_codon:yes gene_type:complete